MVLITNVVNCLRRNRQTIFTIFLVRCFLHHTNNTLNDVIHISKITLAVAIVENIDGFALHQLVGESEVGHVRTTCRTIHCEKAQTSRRNVVQLEVSVSHQLIRLLGCYVQRDRIVHFVVSAIRNLFIGTVNAGGGGVNQML